MRERAKEAQIKGARSPKPRATPIGAEDIRIAFSVAEATLPAIQVVSTRLGRQLGIKGQNGLSEANLKALGAVIEVFRLARLASKKPVIQSAAKDGEDEPDAGIKEEI